MDNRQLFSWSDYMDGGPSPSITGRSKSIVGRVGEVKSQSAVFFKLSVRCLWNLF